MTSNDTDAIVEIFSGAEGLTPDVDEFFGFGGTAHALPPCDEFRRASHRNPPLACDEARAPAPPCEPHDDVVSRWLTGLDKLGGPLDWTPGGYPVVWASPTEFDVQFRMARP